MSQRAYQFDERGRVNAGLHRIVMWQSTWLTSITHVGMQHSYSASSVRWEILLSVNYIDKSLIMEADRSANNEEGHKASAIGILVSLSQ